MHTLVGQGGRPFGTDASRIAVQAAAESLRTQLTRLKVDDGELRQRAAETAMQAAMDAIRQEGARRGISGPDGGLQTTLIIVVSPSCAGTAGFAYIGDGLGVCHHAGGETVEFLKPQKADPMHINLLAACIGPQVLGAPVSGQFERDEASWIVIATDGVADRVGPRFTDEFLAHAKLADGDLMAACQNVLG